MKDQIDNIVKIIGKKWEGLTKKNLTLELRVPISPAEGDMRSLQFLLESIQKFGGPIARSAHCVASVSPEGEYFDLKQAYSWTRNHSLDFHWVAVDHFHKWKYDATGFDRFWIKSAADVVAMIDVDLLVAEDFDDVIRLAFNTQKMMGFIAHVSPFGFKGASDLSSHEWWEHIYKAAKLPIPNLDQQYTGWGLDWPPHIASKDNKHRFGPFYFNYGFIVGPRHYFDLMGTTFIDELEAVNRVVPTELTTSEYKSQIANCLSFTRHNIPCQTIPINYNFPLNLPAESMRDLNPDPDGKNSINDIKIFHYIGGRRIFESESALHSFLNQDDLSPHWEAFKAKLDLINNKINSAQN